MAKTLLNLFSNQINFVAVADADADDVDVGPLIPNSILAQR